MIEQIFRSPQGIQSMTSSSKLIYELPSDLRTTQENLKSSWHFCLVLSPPPEMKILLILEKIL